MSSAITVLYNGVDPFYPQPIPFIGFDSTPIYYNGYWANLERLTLEGQITGCTFGQILTGQQNLLNNFGLNFQSLQIWETVNGTSGLFYQKDYVQIESISFPSTHWRGIMPYTVNLSCWPKYLFSGYFGVIDPVDTWRYEEQNGVIMNAVHTVSCKGFNTNTTVSNAMQNAMNWAQGRSGTVNYIAPILISGAQLSNLNLITLAENIDRFNGTYSLTESYTSDLARAGYGILRYSTNFTSGSERIVGIIEGNARGYQKDIVSTRNAFLQLDKFAALSRQYQRMFGRNDLNPNFIDNHVTEDPYEASIDFSYTYDNINEPDVYYDYTVGLASGNKVTASIDGTIVTRGGDIRQRLQKALNYEKTLNLYNLTLPYYNNYYPYAAAYPLNPFPVNSGYSINESNGTVSLRADFTSDIQLPAPIQQFHYTMRFVPAVQKLDSQPVLNGLGTYSTIDLGYKNRASLAIGGDALVDTVDNVAAGVQVVKNKAQQLFSAYGHYINPVLESNTIGYDIRDKRKINFTFVWTFDSFYVVGLYGLVNTLSV